MKALTKQQRRTLEVIAAFIREHGYAPTYTEIAVKMDLQAIATVAKHVLHLQEKGYLKKRWNLARSIELTTPTDVCPTCGQAVPR